MARIGDRITYVQGQWRKIATVIDYIPEVDAVVVRDDRGGYVALSGDEVEQKIETDDRINRNR